MNKIFVSKFNKVFDTKKSTDLTLQQYIDVVKNGEYKETVEKARSALINGFPKEYKAIKGKLPAVTGSAIMNNEGRSLRHIQKDNGLIVVDIDEDISNETIQQLKEDKYTLVLHKSVSGSGICIFVKINANQFGICFDELAEYYRCEYDVNIDRHCKDKTRLRYISYVPDIFVNKSAIQYKNVGRKEKTVPTIQNFVFLQTDFDEIIRTITSQQINITESYAEYFNIAAAISSEFGISGEGYFKAVASCSTKYESGKASKLYQKCCDRGNLGVNLATFYFYARAAGVEIYSQRTKKIVSCVTAGKANKEKGNTKEGAIKVLQAKGIEITTEEKKLVSQIWNSATNYDKEVNKDTPKIIQIRDYITDNYPMYFDAIKGLVYTEDKQEVNDKILNNICISLNTTFDWNIPMSDVTMIIGSDAVETYNPIKDFFNINIKDVQTGYIDKYASALYAETLEDVEYNKWCFKKWLVGAVHNWTSDFNDPITCPLTLVICGKQGSGKTQFFRRLYPAALKDYCLEERIDAGNKDSLVKLGQSLILIDDEFGGMATKDAKAFKELSDKRIVEIRRPYKRTAEKFKRRAILGGTSNDKELLKDVTGNRRILPVSGDEIDFNTVNSVSPDLIWLEAYKLLKEGFEWKIYTDEDIIYLNQHSEDFNTVDPYEERLFAELSINKTSIFYEPTVLNQSDIMEWFAINTQLKPNKYEIKDVFTRNKLKYTAHRVDSRLKKGYKLFCKGGSVFANITKNTDEAPF